MADDKAKEVIKTWERRDGDRGTTKTHWQECANYMQPNRNDYTVERASGMKRMQWVFDSTPIWALEQSSAGLHSYLTSSTLPWFALSTFDERLNAIDRVGAWLDDASDRMYGLFNSPKHNFASQTGELYPDVANIGTGVMGVFESAASTVLFSTRHLKECCIAENDEDRVDDLVRRWRWTAKQAMQYWPDAKFSNTIVKAAADKPDEKFWFLHHVKPRLKRDAQRADRRHKPFESVWVSEDDATIIDEGGFDEFPYLIPRLSKVTGEIYGRGFGMTALPDVKMLNEMAKTILKAAQKVVDPPLQVPDDGFIVKVKTTPGSLNFYRSGSRDRIEAIKTEGDVKLGLDMLNALRTQIMRVFYVDLMRMPSDPGDPAGAGKGVTATYVLHQRDQEMQLLAPMLARLQAEFLGPLIDRTFAILWRKSVALKFGPGSPFAPPPPELSGVPLRVEYVSPIAIAQKTSRLDGINKLMDTQQRILQIDPKQPVVLDTEAIMRITGKDLHTDATALKSPERLAQEQQAQAQAQQDAATHAGIANLAGSAKDGTGAMKNLAEAAATLRGGGQDQAGGADVRQAA